MRQYQPEAISASAFSLKWQHGASVESRDLNGFFAFQRQGAYWHSSGLKSAVPTKTTVPERPTGACGRWQGDPHSNTRNVTACADIAMTYPTVALG